jgi:putative DNA primase/helicase
VFVASDPYCGVDLDELNEDARRIVGRLASYTERSVSGRGAHVIVRAELAAGARHRTGWLEVYDRGRYFVVTGEHLGGTPATIEPRQAEFELVLAEYLPVAAPAQPQRPARPVELDAREVLERMLARRPHLLPLWNGDTSGHGDDHSAADLALARELSFWTGRDAARIDALLRSSGLMRPKGDERRGDTAYGALTIATAITGTTDTYEPRTSSRSTCAESAERSGRMAQTERAEARKDPIERAFRAYRAYRTEKRGPHPSSKRPRTAPPPRGPRPCSRIRRRARRACSSRRSSRSAMQLAVAATCR